MRLEVKTKDALKFMKAPAIGKALKITRQAVYQWGDLVPEASAFKLITIKPEIPHKHVA